MRLFPLRQHPPCSVRDTGVTGPPLRQWSVLLAFALLTLLSALPPAEAKEKVRIGTVENVVLLPWGVQIPARVDTGAATSSLDARNLTVKGNEVEFNLPPQYGGRQIRLPIAKWRTIKSSHGSSRRPAVVVELCMGPVRIKTQVNLVDRSTLRYPLLIGRNTLMRDFIIECDTQFCTKPSCPEVAPR